MFPSTECIGMFRTWCTVTGAERLRVVACAQAAGWQRAGRAGRTQAGAAYRLYTAREFTRRPPHNTPEIVRSIYSFTFILFNQATLESYSTL